LLKLNLLINQLDDGSVFISVNSMFDEVQPTVVSIYYKGKNINRKKGTDFNIDKTKLIETVSHSYWWLDESGDVDSVALKKVKQGTLVLEIHTIDKKTHWIDVKTGEFIPQP
jgi:hypothetical protein